MSDLPENLTDEEMQLLDESDEVTPAQDWIDILGFNPYTEIDLEPTDWIAREAEVQAWLKSKS